MGFVLSFESLLPEHEFTELRDNGCAGGEQQAQLQIIAGCS